MDAATKSERVKRHREAAKTRRDQETVELNHLAKLLPVPTEAVDKLDKGAVLRLVLAYLKLKEEYKSTARHSFSNAVEARQNGTEQDGGGDSTVCWTSDSTGLEVPASNLEAQVMLDIMDGFLVFVDGRANIMYASDNIDDHLHMQQIEVMGKNIADFIHPDDKREFARQFILTGMDGIGNNPAITMESITKSDEDICVEGIPRDTVVRERLFYVRMKCNVLKPGAKFKQSGYSLVQWSGKLRLEESRCRKKVCVRGLVAVCRLMQSSPLVEIRLDGNMFMSRHSLDMSFTFCDTRVVTLIGYDPEELIGKTAYQFHNPNDAQKIQSCHSNLIKKGTSVSKYYRFLGKTGCWVWLQTRATIIYNTKDNPQYVVCMNYVIGEDEGQRYLEMEQEEQGIPASSQQAEPAGFTQETYYPLPNETDHSRYCAPFIPSPPSPNRDGGSPNTDSGCEMSPYEDDMPPQSTKEFSFPELNSICTSTSLSSNFGDTLDSMPNGFAEQSIFDLIEETINPSTIMVADTTGTNQEMLVDENKATEQQLVAKQDSDLLTTDIEMMDDSESAREENSDMTSIANSVINSEILAQNSNHFQNPFIRPKKLSAESQEAFKKYKSEIGNGILRALLNEEKEDIFLSNIVFKQNESEQKGLKDLVSGVNLSISENGRISMSNNGNIFPLSPHMPSEQSAKLLSRLGASPEDIPACISAVINQAPVMPVAAPPVEDQNEKKPSLLHQLVSCPREQRSTLLQITQAQSSGTNTVTKQSCKNTHMYQKYATSSYKGKNGNKHFKMSPEHESIPIESKQPGSCLEQLLLSDMNYSPNQGSDVIIEMENAREKIASMDIQSDSPLLKQLLVGAIDRRKLASGGHSHELLRRHSPQNRHSHNHHHQHQHHHRSHQSKKSIASTAPSTVATLLGKPHPATKLHLSSACTASRSPSSTASSPAAGLVSPLPGLSSPTPGPNSPHSPNCIMDTLLGASNPKSPCLIESTLGSPATIDLVEGTSLAQNDIETTLAEPTVIESTLAESVALGSGLAAPGLVDGLSLPVLSHQDDMGYLLSGLTPEAETMMLQEVESLFEGSNLEVDALLAEEARQSELWHKNFQHTAH